MGYGVVWCGVVCVCRVGGLVRWVGGMDGMGALGRSGKWAGFDDVVRVIPGYLYFLMFTFCRCLCGHPFMLPVSVACFCWRLCMYCVYICVC